MDLGLPAGNGIVIDANKFRLIVDDGTDTWIVGLDEATIINKPEEYSDL